jgi:hypothetical protein
LDALGLACPLFALAHPKGQSKNSHLHWFKEVKVDVFIWFHNWFKNFILPLLLLKTRKSFYWWTHAHFVHSFPLFDKGRSPFMGLCFARTHLIFPRLLLLEFSWSKLCYLFHQVL